MFQERKSRLHLREEMNQEIIELTEQWIKTFVIKNTLCPFAKKPVDEKAVHYVSTQVVELEDVLLALHDLIYYLNINEDVSTAFLILGKGMNSFDEFLNLMDLCNDLIQEIGHDQNFQLVGFHPNFQFEGLENGDPQHRLNRSPFPMIHVLRVAEVEQAILSHGDIPALLERNKKILIELTGN